MTRKKFYSLSFTWGIVLSAIGLIVCVALMCIGYKPKKYNNCYYIAVGKNWGGLEFGWFFLTDSNESTFIKNHELGHAYQNIKYGPVTFLLWLVAAGRYWMKQAGVKLDYYSWWYESEANVIGNQLMPEETNNNQGGV